MQCFANQKCPPNTTTLTVGNQANSAQQQSVIRRRERKQQLNSNDDEEGRRHREEGRWKLEKGGNGAANLAGIYKLMIFVFPVHIKNELEEEQRAAELDQQPCSTASLAAAAIIGEKQMNVKIGGGKMHGDRIANRCSVCCNRFHHFKRKKWENGDFSDSGTLGEKCQTSTPLHKNRNGGPTKMLTTFDKRRSFCAV